MDQPNDYKRKTRAAKAAEQAAAAMLVDVDLEEPNKKRKSTTSPVAASSFIAPATASSHGTAPSSSARSTDPTIHGTAPSSTGSIATASSSSFVAPAVSSSSSSSSSSVASNEGDNIGTQSNDDEEVDLDAWYENNYAQEEDSDAAKTTTTHTNQSDGGVVGLLMSMTISGGRSFFETAAESSTFVTIPARRKKDDEFHDNLPGEMDDQWKRMDKKERKLYEGSPSSSPPKPCIISVVVDGVEEIIAAPTSIWGKFPYCRYIPGPKGEKIWYRGSKEAGDIDPKSLAGLVGGKAAIYSAFKPGTVYRDFRGCLIVECVRSEKDPRFIAAVEAAEGNKDLYARTMATVNCSK